MQDHNEHQLLWGQHYLFDDRTTPRLCVAGGVGSGKTVLQTVFLHRNALEFPGQVQWFCSHTHQLVTTVCFATYETLLKQWGYVKGTHYHTKANNYIRYFNGSEIYFYSAVAYEKWVGKSLIAAAGDEPGRWPAGAFSELIERLRGPKLPDGRARQIFFGGSPQGLTEYYNIFAGPDMQSTGITYNHNGEEKDLVRVSEDGSKKVLHFPTFFNHTIDRESYITNLLAQYGHNENLVRAHILGEFVPLFANNCYNITDDNITDCTPNEDIPNLYISFDFNIGAMAWTAFQVAPDNTAYCVAECPKRVARTRDACIEIIKKFPKNLWRNHRLTIVGDASGMARSTTSYVNNYDIIKEELKDHFDRILIKVPKVNGPVDLRIEATNLALTKNEYTGRPPLLYFDTSCQRVISSMYSTHYDNKGGIAKPPGEDITHPSDTVGYFCNEVFPFKHVGSLGVSY